MNSLIYSSNENTFCSTPSSRSFNHYLTLKSACVQWEGYCIAAFSSTSSYSTGAHCCTVVNRELILFSKFVLCRISQSIKLTVCFADCGCFGHVGFHQQYVQYSTCAQLTKAYVAKTFCNQLLLINSAAYIYTYV